MRLLQNPFNVNDDIDELCAELRHEDTSAEKTFKLYGKIIAKGLGGGALWGVAVGLSGIAIGEGILRTIDNQKKKAR